MAAVAFLLCGVLVACSAASAPVHFFTTQKTPAFILRLIADLFPRAEVATTYRDFDPDGLVLDYSYDEAAAHAMRTEHTIVMWRTQQTPCFQNNAFLLKFTEYLQRLNFTQVVLIADTGSSRLEMCHRLLDTFPSVYAEVISIPNHADVSYSLDLVGRVIKPSGNNLFALFTEENSAWSLLQAFEKKRLMKEGFAFVLCGNAAYFQQFGAFPDGLLYVAPAVSALARSPEEAERMKLLAVADWLIGGQTSMLLPLNIFDESAVLVNIRSGKPTIVATSPTQAINAVFPGNTTVIPKRQEGIIPVSVHYEWTLSGGSAIPGTRVTMRGLQVAFEEKNNGTELFPMFRVADRSLELGRYWIDPNFTRQKVASNPDSLGLIHFPSPTGSIVLSIFKTLRELNVSLPMCMSVGGTALSSPKDYPLFVRPRTSDLYTARVFATVFKLFGWKKTAVLYRKDGGANEDVYRAFLNYSAEFGINITNSEPSREVADTLDDGLRQLNESLLEIMRSDVRILVVFHEVLPMILKALYDLGVRSRFLIVYYIGLSISELNGDSRKYRAVVKGALQIFPRAFIGKVGQKVLKELIAKDGLNYYSNSCFYYDAAMLYMHATDYLIRMGHDYEDPYEIVKAMRSTHFTGCSGTITIAPGLNDKAEAEYSIMNLKYFEHNDSVILEDAMHYNPFSVVLFKSVNAFMWPDNSTVFTDTLVSNFDCPFLESDARHYPTGMMVGLIVTFNICFATILATAFIWRKWWMKRYPFLSGKIEQSADDLLQMIAVPVEFFQFAALGPESHEISHTISQIINSTTLQLDDFLSASGSTYWYLVKFALACVGMYTYLCVMKLTGLEKKLEWIPLWSFLMLFANLALPVLSNLLFLPIVSVLSKLYLCYHAVGDYLTSSFLNTDCYTFCWTGVHLKYVICGSIALILYIPLGVYAKPMWQEAQEQLHIRAQPLSLMVKSIVQVVLLTISNSLKQDYQDIHAGLFFALITAYFLFKVKYPQYNYPRCALYRLNLWDWISTCTVLAFSIFAFLSRNFPSFSLIYLLAFGSGSAVSIAIGMVAQAKVKQYESHFFTRKMNQSPIFHFAFTFGTRAHNYLDMHYNIAYFSENEARGRVPNIALTINTSSPNGTRNL